MKKIRFSILYRILLAFSFLIIGYIISMILLDNTRQGIENKLNIISDVHLPVEKLTTGAAVSFDNLIKYYNDSVLTGELKLIEDAEAQYNEIVGSLSAIQAYNGVPDRIKEDVSQISSLIGIFNDEAVLTYTQLANGVMSDEILESAKGLNERTEDIKERLGQLSRIHSSYLAQQMAVISQDIKDMQSVNRVIFYAVLIISLFMGIFAIKIILLKPVSSILHSSDQIAMGNLSIEIPVHSNDELGDLSNRFNRMTQQLIATVSAIQDSYTKMKQRNTELENSIKNFVGVVEKQSLNLNNISDYLKDVLVSVQHISNNINVLYKNSENTSLSVQRMSDSISGNLASIENLDHITVKTAESSEKLAANIKKTSINANQLNRFAENISASMIEMEQSTKQIESISNESMKLSEEVSNYSKESIDIVQRNINLMNHIRDTVYNTVDDIEGLRIGSKEIGSILIVINDITEQTNLLSLNAAIIAAHSGEHGKGFSVVADEIRNLSERTKVSTREIDELIKGLQNGIKKSVSSMKKTSELVEQGSTQSQETGNALQRILGSAQKSSSISREIVRNTKEQAESSKLITKDVNDETFMIKEMTQTLEDLAVISEEISKAVEEIKNSSKESKHAMASQSNEALQLSEAMKNVSDMVFNIKKASQEQNEKSTEIKRITELLKKSTEENLQSIKNMTDSLSGLRRESGLLNEAISRFRINREDQAG